MILWALEVLYPYIKFVLGTLYPAYKTWKSLKRKDETTRRQWMKYWVCFGAFQLFELVADITLAFVTPFYTELKLAFIMWLVMGSKLVFDSIVNRELAKREKLIDRWLNKIFKIRDEFVALVWCEISRYSIKIIVSIMSGGFSIITKLPEHSEQTSPICSEVEEEDIDAKDEQQKLKLELKQEQENENESLDNDLNKNTVSMEWSAITLMNDVRNLKAAMDPPRARRQVVTRKSARQRELSSLRSTESI